MMRAVNYVLHTRKRILKFIPERNGNKWELMCMCDSDYAGNKDNRLSVTDYYTYKNGYLILWKLRAQRSHTLSSTEAEYVALSKICMEILFAWMIMDFLKQPVKYPIKVYCDNIDGIYFF